MFSNFKPPPASVRDVEPPPFFQPTIPQNQPSMSQTMPQTFYQPQTFQQPQQTFVGFNQPIPQAPQQQLQQQQIDSQKYNYSQSAPFNPQQQQAQVQAPPKQPEKPVVVEKGPVPVEHQVIKTVFDTLLNKCLSATTVLTTKRKLEDVQKKQELLYDKLRDSTVSLTLLKKRQSKTKYKRIKYVFIKC